MLCTCVAGEASPRVLRLPLWACAWPSPSALRSVCPVTGPVTLRHWGPTRTMVPPRTGPVLKGPGKPGQSSGVTCLGFGGLRGDLGWEPLITVKETEAPTS